MPLDYTIATRADNLLVFLEDTDALMKELKSGDIIDGRYELVSVIGKGGMGEVWTAVHITLKRLVALKVIRAELLHDKSTAARFLREARSTAQLRNRHVVQVLDHGNQDGLVFIAMELMRGVTLRSVMQLSSSPLPLEDVRRLFRHCAMGIRDAHDNGIVHRDLKPGNLFVNIDQHGWHLKLMDFGLAKPVELDANDSIELKTRQGNLLGTPAYMSPERLRHGDNSIYADLWSMAIIAYELVCGERPFSAENQFSLLFKIATESAPIPSSRCSTVPPGFDEWFGRACHPKQGLRFDNASELVGALDDVLVSSKRSEAALSIRMRLANAAPDESLPTLNWESHLQDFGGELTQVDNLSISENVKGASAEPVAEPSVGSDRNQLTPIEVAELQTQIQYRLIEQLLEAREANEKLQRELDGQKDQPKAKEDE